jgi:hypothetical protein
MASSSHSATQAGTAMKMVRDVLARLGLLRSHQWW